MISTESASRGFSAIAEFLVHSTLTNTRESLYGEVVHSPTVSIYAEAVCPYGRQKDNPSAFQRTLNIYYHVLSSFISKMQTATKSDRLA